MERVDDHDLALAVLQVAEAAEEVGDHAVTRDHRVREDLSCVNSKNYNSMAGRDYSVSLPPYPGKYIFGPQSVVQE